MQKWNGQFFENTTLKNLGLTLQLGHPPGQVCLAPALGPLACAVIHMNGIHPVNIPFCQCTQLARASDTTKQLLWAGLYGATLTDPTTFCSIEVLQHFHLLTLQSKITAYDYYMALQKLTDVGRLGKQFVSLETFHPTI